VLGNKPRRAGWQQPLLPWAACLPAATRAFAKPPVLAVKPGSCALAGSEGRAAKKNTTPTASTKAMRGHGAGNRLQRVPVQPGGCCPAAASHPRKPELPQGAEHECSCSARQQGQQHNQPSVDTHGLFTQTPWVLHPALPQRLPVFGLPPAPPAAPGRSPSCCPQGCEQPPPSRVLPLPGLAFSTDKVSSSASSINHCRRAADPDSKRKAARQGHAHTCASTTRSAELAARVLAIGGPAVPIPRSWCCSRAHSPQEDAPTKPGTSSACPGADSLPSRCPLKHRSLPLPCSHGAPLLLGAAQQPPPHQTASPPCKQGQGQGRRRGQTCPSAPAANQVSAAPIGHPAEQSSGCCTATPASQLIKKLGCLPETDDKRLLPPTQGRHLAELRGLVQQQWPRVLTAASLCSPCSTPHSHLQRDGSDSAGDGCALFQETNFSCASKCLLIIHQGLRTEI